jgi:hypothetical protein
MDGPHKNLFPPLGAEATVVENRMHDMFFHVYSHYSCNKNITSSLLLSTMNSNNARGSSHTEKDGGFPTRSIVSPPYPPKKVGPFIPGLESARLSGLTSIKVENRR